ncbi:MAG: metal-dependent hydrolase [Solirubrobacteraceae bacterium]
MSSYSAWPFLSDPSHPFLSAVWAVLIHGVLGVLCVAPLIWRSGHRVGYGALAFIGGSVLDVDHFIAAGSLNLHTIETMSGRPATHSLGFVILLGVVALLITRRRLAAWAVFAVNLSHLLFDAAGGGVRVLYPLEHPDGLPWLACPIGTLALLAISTVLAGGLSRPPSRLDRSRRGFVHAA